MNSTFVYLKQAWSRSRVFRFILVVALIYTMLRLGIQIGYLVVISSPGLISGVEQLEWTKGKMPAVPVDLQVYLDAAEHFQQRQDLYLQESLSSIEYHFPYPPSFALAFIPFLWLSPLAVSVVHTLFHIVAYVLLYIWWGRIFSRFNLKRACELLAWTLPVWLVFTEFWSDLSYLNIYILLALASTFLIDAILNERLSWSVLWLSLIIQAKPMWAFAVAIPLILGRYRFLIKLLAWTFLVYIVVAGATILIAGPSYGWQQYVDYVRILGRLGRDFPWRGPDAPFLGYNHSIKQIMAYLFGPSTAMLHLATIIKILLLLPLGIISMRHIVRPIKCAGHKVPYLGLNLAFALYLGAFIWLDIVWEVALGIVVFVYLLSVLEQKSARLLVWVIFLAYALADSCRIAGLAMFGLDIILPGPYVLTDPDIHVPLVMIVILTFYALLVKALWNRSVYQLEEAGS